MWNGFPLCLALLHGVQAWKLLIKQFTPPDCCACNTSTTFVRHCCQKTFKDSLGIWAKCKIVHSSKAAFFKLLLQIWFLASNIYLKRTVQFLCSSKTLCVFLCLRWSLSLFTFALCGFTFSSMSTNIFHEPYSWSLSMYLTALRKFRVSPLPVLPMNDPTCTFDNICPDVKCSQRPF